MVIRFASARLAVVLSLLLLVTPFTGAQPAGKVYRIGVLFEYGPLDAMAGIEPRHPHLRPFLQRQQELGYVEGRIS